jgi:hypothetical protein
MTLEEYKKAYTEDDAVGWDAITDRLNKFYGEQEPQHFAPVPHYAVGGESPLDGISVYESEKQTDHFHFITYGFSELYYDEDSAGEDESGCGFELTFRLKKKGDDDNIHWACNLLQNIAKYVFDRCTYFEEFHVFPTNSPIRLDYQTELVALAFIEDPQLGTIDTPNGAVQFLQMVGLTAKEYEEFKQNPYLSETEKIIEKLKVDNELLITDLDRK